MVRSKGWGYSEEKTLMANQDKLTIKELERMFPNRSRESINNKIKRLKRAGKIKEGKDPSTIKRAYNQRGKDVE